MPKQKSRAQRLAALQSYSSSIEPNPLITIREELGLTIPEMAAYLGVNKLVVQQAEEGCYILIPRCYRARIRNIMATNAEYQSYRETKRQFHWDPLDFPEQPAPRKPMVELLKHFDLIPYTFATRACIQSAEIWKMCTDARMATVNFVEFLETVGINQEWIKEFNRALSFNATAPVKLDGAGVRTKLAGIGRSHSAEATE